MADKIQRWKPAKHDIFKIKMEVDPKGKYVKYSDFLDARAELISAVNLAIEAADYMDFSDSHKDRIAKAKVILEKYKGK